MPRNPLRTIAFLAVSVPPAALMTGSGCGDPVLLAGNPEGGPATFVQPSSADAAAEGGITQYCPSDTCPGNLTTCPTSQYPCDVDLKSDSANCGACGVPCPGGSQRESYQCVNAVCALQCGPLTYDCDGLVDNGCETDPDDNNCGGCGIKCDPGVPCVELGIYRQCGCPAGYIFCTDPYPNCVLESRDDNNCGACNNVCDPTGGGKPLTTNTYYGCVASECDRIKCVQGTDNCDGIPENGCETSLNSKENCGYCGNACGPDEECRMDITTGGLQCMCPTGQTRCELGCFGDLCFARCSDLSSSRRDCGACGSSCADGLPYGNEMCLFGECKLVCASGRANCNGNGNDGCEINTNSDPHNCGGCGVSCDLVAGQACVLGSCVVEPCNPETGGAAR